MDGGIICHGKPDILSIQIGRNTLKKSIKSGLNFLSQNACHNILTLSNTNIKGAWAMLRLKVIYVLVPFYVKWAIFPQIFLCFFSVWDGRILYLDIQMKIWKSISEAFSFGGKIRFYDFLRVAVCCESGYWKFKKWQWTNSLSLFFSRSEKWNKNLVTHFEAGSK